MHQLHLILLIQVSLLVGWSLVEAKPAAEGVQYFETELSRAFLDKLNTFAEDENATTSGLNFYQLRRVFEESQRWDEQTLGDLRADSADFGLLIDFGITPMSHYDELIGDDLEDVDNVHRDYFERFERAYKTFRPNYQGKIAGETYSVAPKLSRAVDSLYGAKDSLPLDSRILMEAKFEFVFFQERINEIKTVEDIYAHLNEYREMLNLFNYKAPYVFGRYIMPLISEGKKNFPEIAQTFRDAMAVYKIVCIDGVVKKLEEQT